MTSKIIAENVIRSDVQDINWLLNPVRKTFDLYGSEADVLAYSRVSELDKAVIYFESNKLLASFTDEASEDLFLFAETYRGYLNKSKSTDNGIALEVYDGRDVVMVAVVDGTIVADSVLPISEVLITLKLIAQDVQMKFQATQKPKPKFDIHVSGISANPSGKDERECIALLAWLAGREAADVIYTASIFDMVKPDLSLQLKHVQYALKDAPSRPVGTKGKVLVGIAIVVGAITLFNYMSPDKEVDVVYVDPYEAYATAVNTKYIDPLPRLQQEYDVLTNSILFVDEWNVFRANINTGFSSYVYTPAVSTAQINGLREFGQDINVWKNERLFLNLEIDHNGYHLSQQGINLKYSYNESREIFKVEDVHVFIDDNVARFIPGAQVKFLRDIPQGGGNSMSWLQREIQIHFTDMFREDLITLGVILSKAPISFGGAEDLNGVAGFYEVNGLSGKLNGILTVTIVGVK